jgi:hypothetical protein
MQADCNFASAISLVLEKMINTYKKRESSGLKGYDYPQNGYYFVTICTNNGIE